MGALIMVSASAILAVGAMLLVEAAVPNAAFITALRKGIDTGDPVRTWSELAYFMTGTVLAAIALLALLFARRQAWFAREQARHARAQAEQAALQNQITANATADGARASQARAYTELFRHERHGIVAGLDVCAIVERDFRLLTGTRPKGEALGKHADAMVAQWERSDSKTYNALIALLTELENLGLLVRRGYYSMDDVYFLLEGPLDIISNVFLIHVQRRMASSTDGRECEHGEWLLRNIVGYVPTANLAP